MPGQFGIDSGIPVGLPEAQPGALGKPDLREVSSCFNSRRQVKAAGTGLKDPKSGRLAAGQVTTLPISSGTSHLSSKTAGNSPAEAGFVRGAGLSGSQRAMISRAEAGRLFGVLAPRARPQGVDVGHD